MLHARCWQVSEEAGYFISVHVAGILSLRWLHSELETCTNLCTFPHFFIRQWWEILRNMRSRDIIYRPFPNGCDHRVKAPKPAKPDGRGTASRRPAATVPQTAVPIQDE